MGNGSYLKDVLDILALTYRLIYLLDEKLKKI